MKIAHVFHHFNEFGGAEEHITSLAELQKAGGHEVCVYLIQSASSRNQYFQRLKLAGVPVAQWPVWISRLSGDWNTKEAISRFFIAWLTPLIVAMALLLAFFNKQPRERLRKSIEGRIRTILGSLIDLQRERQLFLNLLSLKYSTNRPDVLHLHSYGAGLEYVLQWANTHKMHMVYQEHSTPDLTTRDWYKLPVDLNMAEIVIAVSEVSAQALRNYCGVTRPIIVVPPIVVIGDAHSVQMTPKDGKPGIQILTIARLSDEKGIPFLINAAESILSKHADICFTIYGEGPLRAGLEKIIQKKHLQAQIRLAGSFVRQELAEVMGKADIFVLPSITEGLPLTLVEAMAWGLPIVSTRVGGIPDLIEHGVNGLLCAPGDANDLAEKISLLINEPALRFKLGCDAQRSYENGPYRAETVGKQYETVYHQIINGA